MLSSAQSVVLKQVATFDDPTQMLVDPDGPCVNDRAKEAPPHPDWHTR